MSTVCPAPSGAFDFFFLTAALPRCAKTELRVPRTAVYALLGLCRYLGAGVAACYRGRRPYLSDQIRAMVTKWIGFYKAHRGTLIQPIVHLRRPDLQGWDGWLHVNPFKLGGQKSVKGSRCPEVGLAMLFNPTDITLTNQSVWLPLYVAIAFSLLVREHLKTQNSPASPRARCPFQPRPVWCEKSVGSLADRNCAPFVVAGLKVLHRRSGQGGRSAQQRKCHHHGARQAFRCDDRGANAPSVHPHCSGRNLPWLKAKERLDPSSPAAL